ncbi:MAG: hypothetical protein K940chlam3_00226 [Chlamydiae bacterium]|nr:hypothetical protein [Chlamydiota bacterium]
MEKPKEIPMNYTPFLTIEKLKEIDKMETIPTEILKYFELLSEKDPLFKHQPKVCFQILSILNHRSQSNPKLVELTTRIQDICSKTKIFSNPGLPENFRLKTQEGEVVLINETAFESSGFFDQIEAHSTSHKKNEIDLTEYSLHSIELLKDYIYYKTPIDSKEDYQALFDLLDLAYSRKNSQFHDHIFKVLIEKVKTTTSVKLVLDLKEVMELKKEEHGEISNRWLEIYLTAVVAASQDECFWEFSDVLISTSTFTSMPSDSTIHNSLIKICLQCAFSLSSRVTDKTTFLNFYRFLNVLSPLSDFDKQKFIVETLVQIFKIEKLNIIQDNGRFIVPAEYLNRTLAETHIGEIIRTYLGEIRIRRGNEFDRSLILQSAALFHSKMDFIKNINIEYGSTLTDEDIFYLSEILPNTHFHLKYNFKNKLENRSYMPEAHMDRNNKFFAVCKKYYDGRPNIHLEACSPPERLHFQYQENKENWKNLGKFLRDNLSIKQVEIYKVNYKDKVQTIRDLLSEFRPVFEDNLHYFRDVLNVKFK